MHNYYIGADVDGAKMVELAAYRATKGEKSIVHFHQFDVACTDKCQKYGHE